MFCCVRGYAGRRAWRTTVSPTRWTPFPFRPVHAWLVWCWPACVWSVYGQVAAAAAVWLVRGCLGRLMVGLVCVGSVALLPVVVSPNVVCVAGTSVLVLVSCVLVCPSVVECSLLTLVGRVHNGRVAVFCCVRGYSGRPLHAWLVWCWPPCVWSVYGRVVAAAVVLLVHCCVSRLMVGLFGVGSLALLQALARSDVVRVVVLLVSVLVDRARVGLRLGLC